MIALAIALLLMQQPQGWYGGDISGTGGFHWISPRSTYWNDEPVALPPSAQCTHDHPCTGSTTHLAIPSPERFDVPAVQEMAMDSTGDLCYHGRTFNEWGMVRAKTRNFTQWNPIIDSLSKKCEGKDWEEQPKPRWSCADKSRVLLQSENGVRHCIKF